jgi:pimeloyl-ACP methyl ester carboxylesterase
VPVGEGKLLHVYRSVPLGGSPAIHAALIMVHGTQRNVDSYFATAIAAAQAAGRFQDTIVIAPRFAANDGNRCKDSIGDHELAFPCNGWKDGQAALNSRVDSFAAMDAVLALLDDSKRFPNLRRIIVAGHSAGGQYVQRYAAGNRIEPKLKAHVRYVVANPSSYVYLDATRPVAGAATKCPGYDKYKYGLEALTGYMAATGAAAIRERYPKRDVTYLVGELDVNQDADLDKTCPAMMEGLNRRERGVNFQSYMRSNYGAAHKLFTVPGCGHSAGCMFKASAGWHAVFDQ